MTKFCWAVTWGNPYTEPPDGKPHELGRVEVEVPDGTGAPPCPPEIKALHVIGSGYGLRCWDVPKPIVPWPVERRFNYRRKRLEARIRKKCPMFFDQMIAEAMARKPEYYGVKTE